MIRSRPLVGQRMPRVDGPLKVTGTAAYAAEYPVDGLLHGVAVGSTIARGRVVRIETGRACAVPGVVKVITHRNRPRTSSLPIKYKDMVSPPGHPLRLLRDANVHYSGQPVALVVAETYEAARDAAALVRVVYRRDPHVTDLSAVQHLAFDAKGAAPEPRGDAAAAFEAAPVKIEAEFRVAALHHHPLELFATTVVWEGDGRITVYDKTQGSQNVQLYLGNVFGFRFRKVRVVNSYVGGAFGSGLRPRESAFLATLAAKMLRRSVRVVLTRSQMFRAGRRPEAIQHLRLGADHDGRLLSISHRNLAATSQYEDYHDMVVDWAGLLYQCANTDLVHRLAKVDTDTPSDMRAPGATEGMFALESAMDELAAAVNVDPVELRLRNYAERDQSEGKEFTSKALRECYSQGAERFGWSRRTATPRSMRDGVELIGWGMAGGVWEANMAKVARARATLRADGLVEITAAASDIGTGTYTILTQIAADAMGLPAERVVVRIADSDLPLTLVEGGSWTAASSGAAVHHACGKLKRLLARVAAERNVAIDAVVEAPGNGSMTATATVTPDRKMRKTYSCHTHSAVFAEVHVDEELGVIRVSRVVSTIAAGRILNPQTARSQILGGVVMGIGQALHEASIVDHRLGRVMNHNLAEYHVPAHADVREIEVIFVDEVDDKVSPLGVKGVGEIGIVGVAAAIANAIHHATGRRVRSLPITIDKLL
jgi:xanthine dehydrogenase YagR molybdenum-binding subunit